MIDRDQLTDLARRCRLPDPDDCGRVHLSAAARIVAWSTCPESLAYVSDDSTPEDYRLRSAGIGDVVFRRPGHALTIRFPANRLRHVLDCLAGLERSNHGGRRR